MHKQLLNACLFEEPPQPVETKLVAKRVDS